MRRCRLSACTGAGSARTSTSPACGSGVGLGQHVVRIGVETQAARGGNRRPHARSATTADGAFERQPGVVDAVQHVADDVAAQRRRRVRQRPAHEAHAQPALAQDRPRAAWRPWRRACAAPRAGSRSAPAPARTCSRAARRAPGRRRGPGSGPPSARRSSAAGVRWPRWSRSARPASAAAWPGASPRRRRAPGRNSAAGLRRRPARCGRATRRPPPPAPRGPRGLRRSSAGAADCRRHIVGAAAPAHAAAAARPPNAPSSSPAARRSAPCRGGRCAPARPPDTRRRRCATATAASVMRRAGLGREERREVAGVQPQHRGAGGRRDRRTSSASTRTLSQPGDSTCTAATWRSTTARRRPRGRWRRRPGPVATASGPTADSASGNAGLRCSVAMSR